MTPVAPLSVDLLPADTPATFEGAPDQLRLTVPANIELTVVETYSSQPDTVQTRLAITVGENARLTHYKIVQPGTQGIHQSLAEVDVARGAAYRSHVFLLGGAQVRNTIHVRLNGENAECVLNGLYMASGEQKMETHTLIDHLKPHGTSREFYKGILDDRAQGVFDGLIVVQKDAQKTDSIQSNKNLLLSATAKATSNPELKILANDVKCKHGATIGQLSADQLFYLRSRGISAPEARRLLVHAFASEMIDLVENDHIKGTLAALIGE